MRLFVLNILNLKSCQDMVAPEVFFLLSVSLTKEQEILYKN